MSTPLSEADDDKSRALALTPVSRETAERLEAYVGRLLAYQSHTNLIAPSTIPQIWSRHVADSLQLLELAPDAQIWTDFGSGGGFPGLAVACALADRPGARVHLVESTKKKAAFLESTAQALNLPVEVHPVRIEDFVKNFPGPVDVVTARALAPLKTLLALAQPLLQRGAKALFLKGQDIEAELTEAAKSWKIEHALIPSKTHSLARIVVIDHLAGVKGRQHRQRTGSPS